MKKILIIIVTFFFVCGIASSVPVWKKHADLDIRGSEKEILEELLIYTKTEWLYIYEDSTHKSYFYYTNDSGNTYTDLTKRFKESIGNIKGESRMYVTESKHLVVVKTGNIGNSIWFSDDVGKTWVTDTLIRGTSLRGILFRGNDIFIRHSSTFESPNLIYKYSLVDNKVKKELFYLPEDDLYQINDNKFDVNDNDELFIAPNIVSTIYAYYYPRIYDSDGKLISELDFNADYFPYEYNPPKNDNGLVSYVRNVKDSIWTMTMKNNGYFLTYNNGKDWEFIDINGKFKGYEGEYWFEKVKDKPYYLTTVTRYTSRFTYDLSDFGEVISVVDDEGKLTIGGAGIIFYSNGDEIFSYGSSSSIYILIDMELSSVEDSENLVNIRIDPNPVNDILHLRTNSDILIESLSIYDLLGNRLIQQSVNGSNNNFKINCSTLATGTYMIVAQTKSGNITNKFIKW